MRDQSLLIVGAGIGGLCLALGAQRAGFRVIVCEAAAQLGEVGAGLTVSPNATHALEFLGLGETMARLADRPESGCGIHFKTGEVLYRTQTHGSFKTKYGADYYQVHRADLHDALAAAVRANDPQAIRLNHNFVGLAQTAAGVTARFANGETVTAPALVGCDGVRSGVRAALFGAENPKFTGQVSFRGLVPADAVRHLIVPTPSGVYIGPQRIFTRYFLRKRTLVNYVGIARTEAWKEEGWSIPATVEEMLAEYAGWHENVIGIIKATPPGKLFKWALFGRDPLPLWTVGRVTLLGDAAHPMLPFLGMGAAMAMEDAAVLARCLAAAGRFEDAFARYEAARNERTKFVLLKSRDQGELYQSQTPEQMRSENAAGEFRLGLFEYNPATVAI
jgi:salicylate hydroxylase